MKNSVTKNSLGRGTCLLRMRIEFRACAILLRMRVEALRACKMLYFVGLGLGDASDITVKGLDIVKHAARVYLEAYTSILTVGKDELVRKNILVYWVV